MKGHPIRSGMADTPEASDFTSLQQRIDGPTDPAADEAQPLEQAIPELLPFAGTAEANHGLPFAYDDYLELVDWSGRAIHPNKRGKIPDEIPPILQRLGISPERLLRYLNRKERGFYLMIGTPQSFQQAVANLGRRFFTGISSANRLFGLQSV